jgi:hypothetical protein
MPYYKGKKSLAAKVAKLQKQVTYNKPELKWKSVSFSGTATNASILVSEVTSMAQGLLTSNRTGSDIKAVKSKFTIVSNTNTSVSPGLDVYLVTTTNGSQPVYADFPAFMGAIPGPFTLKVLRHFITKSDDNRVFNFKWRTPQTVHYAGPTAADAVKNRTFLVIKNNTGANLSVSYNYILHFTDA